jgi:DNA-binding response OmpR family regulator
VTAARILVVEDSNAIRLPVVTALSAHGFALASAANGNDLERLLPSFAPDLVILDVMLPGRDGFELLQVVRRTSTAAVLMLTARDSLADRLHSLTAGADDYLIKPSLWRSWWHGSTQCYGAAGPEAAQSPSVTS